MVPGPRALAESNSMIIKSKYKIARRLGIPVFEKTQTQKFALSLTRRGDVRKRPRALTDYGKQLLEKQRVRYTYLILERQLKKYVRHVLSKKGIQQDEKLYEMLETRLDNAAYRLGFGPTRLAVKQMTSHGHLCVNGTLVDIPSYSLNVGDTISIREASLKKALFTGIDERLKESSAPAWLKLDNTRRQGTVVGVPKLERGVTGLDFKMVLEFYKR